MKQRMHGVGSLVPRRLATLAFVLRSIGDAHAQASGPRRTRSKRRSAKHWPITLGLRHCTRRSEPRRRAWTRRGRRLLPDAGVSAQLNRSTGNTVPGAFFPARRLRPDRGAATRQDIRRRGMADRRECLGELGRALDRASGRRHRCRARRAHARHRRQPTRGGSRSLTAPPMRSSVLLEAQETVRAATANVDRAQVLVAMTKPLVDQSLRPGVELARAEAELAERADAARARRAGARGTTRAARRGGRPTQALRVEMRAGATPATSSTDVARCPRPCESPTIPTSFKLRQPRRRSARRAASSTSSTCRGVDLVAALWVARQRPASTARARVSSPTSRTGRPARS